MRGAKMGEEGVGIHRIARSMAMLVVLAACGDGDLPTPADAPFEEVRSVVCAREGTSSVTGSGPAGPLDAHHVYVTALSGFCPDTLVLIVTSEDPLAAPYLEGSGVIYAQVPADGIRGTTEWSGTLPATISLADETAPAGGSLQVDLGTPGYSGPTRLRATARFDDGAWHFTAAIDAPYCRVTTCF